MSQLLLICLSLVATTPARSLSFADFDQRAREGQRLNVVFFGALLTWVPMPPTQTKRPTAPWFLSGWKKNIPRPTSSSTMEPSAAPARNWASSGSIATRFCTTPISVFLDFSANDDIYSDNRETLASYESILHRILTEAKCPVVQVIFPFQWDVASKSTKGMKRRDAHLAISRAYNTPVGDAIALGIECVGNGTTTLEKLWPVDGVHPCDEGYVMFADAAWDAFQGAVSRGQVCRVADPMLYGDAYLKGVAQTTERPRPLACRLESWQAAPDRGQFRLPHVVRLDSETIASRPSPVRGDEATSPEPFRAKFTGDMVMFFGETTKSSGKYRVKIDGQVVHYTPWKATQALEVFDVGDFARRIGGNGHHTQVIATGLDPAKPHTLEIDPILEPGEELRLESICVAGPQASVEPCAVTYRQKKPPRRESCRGAFSRRY